MEPELKLSIIVPAYNEGSSITELLNRVCQAPLPLNFNREIIVVDDGSSDNTMELLQAFTPPDVSTTIHLLSHSRNMGKGMSIRTALNKVTGNLVLIQDADLEYDPFEYTFLLDPFLTQNADVVYGSRFLPRKAHRVLFFWHSVGNRFLTLLSNLLTNLNLTDMETGFKVFRSNLLRSMQLNENRFGFEPEITAKIAKMKRVKIFEVSISYYGRTYDEGKKIRWKDGFRAIYCILRYNIFR